MKLFSKLARLFALVEDTKRVYLTIKTKAGKRIKKYFNRPSKNQKTYLQRQHFGTFSPNKLLQRCK